MHYSEHQEYPANEMVAWINEGLEKFGPELHDSGNISLRWVLVIDGMTDDSRRYVAVLPSHGLTDFPPWMVKGLLLQAERLQPQV